MDLDEIYKSAIEDPTLLSTIDVDALIEKMEDNHYLENKSLEDISKEIFYAIQSLGHSNENNENIEQDENKEQDECLKQMCLRLSGYRLVDRICDLRNGRLVRWVKKKNPKVLTNGGLLVNVKIENTGVKLLCKNNMNRFFSFLFDDCLIFQKLSMEEQVILMASS
jgi:hypothetical protein